MAAAEQRPFPQNLYPMQLARTYLSLGITLLVLAMGSGCGKKALAPVHGKVSFNGQPVTVGTLIFSPVSSGESLTPGKGATGDIQSDATYQLSTYSAHDGALVGSHHVRFVPLLDKKAGPAANFANLAVSADYVAVVKSGSENEINIELKKSSAH